MIPALPFERVFQTALREGGDFADLFVEQRHSVLVLCEEDRIERVISGWDIGAGLRVLLEGRTIYSFTNQVTEEGLITLARWVSRAVREGREGNSAPSSWQVQPDFSACTVNPPFPIEKPSEGYSIAQKVSVVKRANDVARGLDRRVRQAKVVYRDFHQSICIAWSEGILREGERAGMVFSVQVVSAEDETVHTGYEAIGGTVGFELFDTDPPETVAEAAGRRSLLLLSAEKAPVGRMTVVLSSEAGGTMIHEAVGHGLEADLAQQGLSVYSNKRGEKIASSLITVVDDPTLPRKRGSYAFDDEGVPSQRTLLVEDGVLRGYLYDRLTALKDGVTSTGNGRRESYRQKPIPRMSNTLIAPGRMKPQEIVRSVEKGLLVKKMGGGQVNTVNGDFVFEVNEGYLIEKGSVTRPVRGATLIGNGPQILKEIDMVGDDLGFGIGTCGKEGQGVPVADAQPTLRIPEIVVGGQQGPDSNSSGAPKFT